MSELAHRILSASKAGYLTRLAISLAVVGASLLPAAILLGMSSDLLVLHWGWIDLFQGLTRSQLPDIPTFVFGLLTAAILAAIALRFRACIIATIWFTLNAIAATVILFDLSSHLGL